MFIPYLAKLVTIPRNSSHVHSPSNKDGMACETIASFHGCRNRAYLPAENQNLVCSGTI